MYTYASTCFHSRAGKIQLESLMTDHMIGRREMPPTSDLRETRVIFVFSFLTFVLSEQNKFRLMPRNAGYYCRLKLYVRTVGW